MTIAQETAAGQGRGKPAHQKAQIGAGGQAAAADATTRGGGGVSALVATGENTRGENTRVEAQSHCTPT